jgi:hypothetical protein
MRLGWVKIRDQVKIRGQSQRSKSGVKVGGQNQGSKIRGQTKRSEASWCREGGERGLNPGAGVRVRQVRPKEWINGWMNIGWMDGWMIG